MRHYHILQTFPKEEKAAKIWLKKHLKANVFLPEMRKLIKPRRKKSSIPIEAIVPVFTGYLFLEWTSNLNWYDVGTCPNIYGYVCNDDKAVTLSSETIDDIAAKVNSGFYNKLEPEQLLTDNYTAGEAVLIKPGDVTMLGTIVEIMDKKLKVEIRATGGYREFIVPVSEVTPAKIIINSLNY